MAEHLSSLLLPLYYVIWVYDVSLRLLLHCCFLTLGLIPGSATSSREKSLLRFPFPAISPCFRILMHTLAFSFFRPSPDNQSLNTQEIKRIPPFFEAALLRIWLSSSNGIPGAWEHMKR